jgi:hypothetical protein
LALRSVNLAVCCVCMSLHCCTQLLPLSGVSDSVQTQP